MKTAATGIVILFIFLAAPGAAAFHLPDCGVVNDERQKSAEEVFEIYAEKMDSLAGTVNLMKIEEYFRNPKIKLEQKERSSAKEYIELKERFEFWKYVVDLKKRLLGLYGEDAPANASDEADTMAKDIIEAIYAISQKWRVGSFAHFQNFLVNIGLKEKGHCYHYAEEISGVLAKGRWSQFDIYWGAARQGTSREHNSVVIAAKGRPFTDGLVVDAWRRAGAPFWIRVADDHYPWVRVDN